ncbi:MAG: hypothetical protein RIR01_49 [Bacteroidota bacterium]|jgi:hypothetical protein
MARTHNEELISLKGHITGVKNSVKVLSVSVYKLEKKVENLYWSILVATGSLSLALIVIFLSK